MHEHPALEAELIMKNRRHLMGLQELLVTLGSKTSLQTVAGFIHFLYFRQQRALTEESRLVKIPFRRPDICDFLSLTTETIRVLESDVLYAIGYAPTRLSSSSTHRHQSRFLL
jgi:CRP-like cAMP-binding protein